MNSFKEEDGDNLVSAKKKITSDDFDPPIEIQGIFTAIEAVEDFMEEIKDSPFQRDGMGLLRLHFSHALRKSRECGSVNQ